MFEKLDHHVSKAHRDIKSNENGFREYMFIEAEVGAASEVGAPEPRGNKTAVFPYT